MSFYFKATTPTQIYTLSLHDALPISVPGDESGEVVEVDVAAAEGAGVVGEGVVGVAEVGQDERGAGEVQPPRSEEHTSELQSRPHLVCRLLLEKKNNTRTSTAESQTL